MSRTLSLHPLHQNNLHLLKAAATAAAEDNHRLDLPPSHIAVKGDEVVGAFLIGPITSWWLHSQKCGVRDSLLCIELLSLKAREMGIPALYILCADSSPYARHMEKFGCENVGHTGVYLHHP